MGHEVDHAEAIQPKEWMPHVAPAPLRARCRIVCLEQGCRNMTDYTVLLTDWADESGVRIEWIHEWMKDQTRRWTAFGYDDVGKSHHNTLIIPDKYDD